MTTIRAYKVITIDYETHETFGFSDDKELVTFLKPYISDYIPLEGGLVHLTKEDLQKALQNAEKKNASIATCNLLQLMIDDAAKNYGSVKYMCF